MDEFINATVSAKVHALEKSLTETETETPINIGV